MIKNTFPGKFIVLEGLDGSGKATQAALAADFFQQKMEVLATCEPSGSLIGDLIRAHLAGDWQTSPECLQLLFASDRAHHLHREIIPKLAAGISVICDRYAFSSFAYGALECDLDWLIDINSNFVMPDLVIFVDVSVDVCVERLAAERKTDEIFEKVGVLKKVALNYEKVFKKFSAEGVNAAVIDGKPGKEVIFENIKAAIQQTLNL